MADELQFVQDYKDIDRMIETHELIMDNCETEIRYYQKQLHQTEPHDISGMNIEGMPHGNYSPISLDRAYDEIKHNENMIEIEKDEIKRLQGKKKEIEIIMNEFEGLYFRVAVMKHIERKSLQEIANTLNYSIDYIKEISASIDKGK